MPSTKTLKMRSDASMMYEGTSLSIALAGD